MTRIALIFAAAFGLCISADATRAATRCSVSTAIDGQTILRAEVEKSADPKSSDVLAIDCEFEGWSKFDNFNLAMFRDGARANDIGLYSIGTKVYKGKPHLDFQFNDPGKKVADHAYTLEARFRFLSPK